jgi:hypothetical protein
MSNRDEIRDAAVDAIAHRLAAARAELTELRAVPNERRVDPLVDRAGAAEALDAADDCEPWPIIDTPDRREICARCGRAIGPHTPAVVRLVGHGAVYHLACFQSEDHT